METSRLEERQLLSNDIELIKLLEAKFPFKGPHSNHRIISFCFRYSHINNQYQSRICHEQNKSIQNTMFYKALQSNVSFFPQMRPEKKQLELTEDEKLIIGLLKTENNQSIAQLKDKSALSGKKWDAAIKALAKHGITRVAVNGENKTVVLN